MAEDDLGAQSAPNPLVIQIDDKKEEIVVPAVARRAAAVAAAAAANSLNLGLIPTATLGQYGQNPFLNFNRINRFI